jgi:hypothetical protein
MTPSEIAGVIAEVDQLWPGADTTDAQLSAFRHGLDRIDITLEQGLACVREFWRDSGSRGWRTPNLQALRRRLVDVYEAGRRRESHTPSVDYSGSVPLAECFSDRLWRDALEASCDLGRRMVESWERDEDVYVVWRREVARIGAEAHDEQQSQGQAR